MIAIGSEPTPGLTPPAVIHPVPPVNDGPLFWLLFVVSVAVSLLLIVRSYRSRRAR